VWTDPLSALEGEMLDVKEAEVGRLPEEKPAENFACGRPGRASRCEWVSRTMDNDR
jgi:hypothetical protein